MTRCLGFFQNLSIYSNENAPNGGIKKLPKQFQNFAKHFEVFFQNGEISRNMASLPTKKNQTSFLSTFWRVKGRSGKSDMPIQVLWQNASIIYQYTSVSARLDSVSFILLTMCLAVLRRIYFWFTFAWSQRTLTVVGSITVQLVSSLARFDSTASLDWDNNIFSALVKSNLVKLEYHNRTVFSVANLIQS